jgi:rhodanese-related sulfurtransferase
MKATTLLFSAMMLTSITACTQSTTSAVAPKEFQANIKPDVQLVDARTAGEYAQGHLANARNLDWNGGELQQRVGELDPKKPVLIYCASGRRSAAAAAFLKEKGFTKVVDLAGGIGAWQQAGMPVTR